MSIRQEVTSKIVQAIEAGTPPWRAGWKSAGPPRNALTGKRYQGINFLMLMAEGSRYADPRWLTFKQAQTMGCKVVKGAKGQQIIKMVEIPRQRAEQEGANSEVVATDATKALVMKGYVVFNAEQIEGIEPLPTASNCVTPVDAINAIAEGMKTTGLEIQTQGNQPAYVPSQDIIKMPPAGRFMTSEFFYSTLLHELAHATGHSKRLNRGHCFARWGTDLYAKEELRAELASAMMMAELGAAGVLTFGPDHLNGHAAYISSWLELLQRDKNEIFKAATDAQRIANYLSAMNMRPMIEPDVSPAAPAQTSHPEQAARSSFRM